MDVGSTNGWRMDDVVPSRDIVAAIHADAPLMAVDPNTKEIMNAGATRTAAVAKSASFPASRRRSAAPHARPAVHRRQDLTCCSPIGAPTSRRCCAMAPTTMPSRRCSPVSGRRGRIAGEVRTAETASLRKVEMSCHRRLNGRRRQHVKECR